LCSSTSLLSFCFSFCFRLTNDLQIRKLKVLSTCERVITEALFLFIEARLRSTLPEELSEAHLQPSLTWMKDVAFEWLEMVFSAETSYYSASLDQWKSKIEHFIYEAVGSLRSEHKHSPFLIASLPFLFRTAQLFDIIVDYPDSMPALEDLKECLRKTRQFNEILASLKSSLRSTPSVDLMVILTLLHRFQKRLLHAGPSTLQILTIYASTIKVRQIIFSHNSSDLNFLKGNEIFRSLRSST